MVVTAAAVAPRAPDALALYAALRERLGADEVFLLEDLHSVDDPAPTVVGFGRLAEITVTGDRVEVSGDGAAAAALRAHCDWHTGRGGPPNAAAVWDLLRTAMDAFDVTTDIPADRFAFGFLTSVGYDAAALMEELPERTSAPSTPDVTVTLYQQTVWFERDGSTPTVITAAGPDLPTPRGADWLRELTAEPVGVPPAPPPESVEDTVDRDTFLDWVKRCLHHVRIGDVYQIQVGHRIDVRTPLTPLAVYRRLRSRNPSPYMYLTRQAGTTLIGASPELHFRVRGGRIVMRPIAGTTRRDPTGVDNERRIKELVASVKEQAEHVMLVDLCRNDIGRVCRPGTLAVDELMAVEAFSHVFHLVSTVSGELAAGMDVWDTLCATFPAGTMTGAPKVRAMQIIDGIEVRRRGPYAGAIGLIDPRGFSELALCIRTIVQSPDGTYSTQSSAGVVALSDPAAEWDETLAKMGAGYWALTGAELR
ncbi:hypothetical protein Acsp05_61520 [Actinokineospora sp. NBRC 105648]|nr:hypothetical protein Acsp05_61520 [Actinokineospora sp. NBRC 105648]